MQFLHCDSPSVEADAGYNSVVIYMYNIHIVFQLVGFEFLMSLCLISFA